MLFLFTVNQATAPNFNLGRKVGTPALLKKGNVSGEKPPGESQEVRTETPKFEKILASLF